MYAQEGIEKTKEMVLCKSEAIKAPSKVFPKDPLKFFLGRIILIIIYYYHICLSVRS